MRRLLTVAVVAAVVAIAAFAAVDVLRGSSSSGESKGERSESPETTVSQPPTFPPPLPSWQGVHRWTIRLNRRAGIAWRETRVLDPGNYDLTLRIDLPQSVGVDVSFQSGSSFTLGLFGRRVPRNCSRRNERDICTSALEFPQSHSEAWGLVVRKLSKGRAVLRLRVAFTRVPPAQG
jgi:hypothetical protein